VRHDVAVKTPEIPARVPATDDNTAEVRDPAGTLGARRPVTRLGRATVRSGRSVLSSIALTVAVCLVATGCTSAPQQPEPSPRESVTATSPAPPATASPTPTPAPVADPLPEGPTNVLLLGTDSREPTDLTGNADTIVVVHVPADRQSVYLISFTRDMWVPIPGLGEGKINAAFARGGTDTLRATVSDLLGGAEIPFTVQANFAGFISLTRWLGGFEVDNQHASTVTVQSTGRVVEFPQGRITLTGTDGLIYVRERKRLPLGDLDRAERQRAALIGMMDKVKQSLGDPVAYAQLVDVLLQNVKVTGDLGVDDALALAPLLDDLTREDVISLMAPITGFGTVDGASVNVVDGPQMAALGEAVRTGTMAQYVATYGTDYRP
jgi:polyisoprenyl-teichoic acid--peptidoglycan teichoic acid transferase